MMLSTLQPSFIQSFIRSFIESRTNTWEKTLQFPSVLLNFHSTNDTATIEMQNIFNVYTQIANNNGNGNGNGNLTIKIENRNEAETFST